ncbi:hypothetical protein KSP40_PGU002647 [Platanthera guangdongensis]|uniref:Uncharacterized protein n=1 Tax=Platanthera guangdongensis TaxID=2320717 RepID=A0ABR2M493_9ASPA
MRTSARKSPSLSPNFLLQGRSPPVTLADPFDEHHGFCASCLQSLAVDDRASSPPRPSAILFFIYSTRNEVRGTGKRVGNQRKISLLPDIARLSLAHFVSPRLSLDVSSSLHRHRLKLRKSPTTSTRPAASPVGESRAKPPPTSRRHCCWKLPPALRFAADVLSSRSFGHETPPGRRQTSPWHPGISAATSRSEPCFPLTTSHNLALGMANICPKFCYTSAGTHQLFTNKNSCTPGGNKENRQTAKGRPPDQTATAGFHQTAVVAKPSIRCCGFIQTPIAPNQTASANLQIDAANIR